MRALRGGGVALLANWCGLTSQFEPLVQLHWHHWLQKFPAQSCARLVWTQPGTASVVRRGLERNSGMGGVQLPEQFIDSKGFTEKDRFSYSQRDTAGQE